MANDAPASVDYDEFVLPETSVHEGSHANVHFSYEALPPNFSILQNCAAGAFAGIAVGVPSQLSH